MYSYILYLYGDVAQLARANGSYPLGQRFESTHRYQNETVTFRLWFFYTHKILNLTYNKKSAIIRIAIAINVSKNKKKTRCPDLVFTFANHPNLLHLSK